MSSISPENKLFQEHSIYKAFYESIKNRPTGIEAIHFRQYLKASLFDVADRLEKLESGIPYCDAAWTNADSNVIPVVG